MEPHDPKPEPEMVQPQHSLSTNNSKSEVFKRITEIYEKNQGGQKKVHCKLAFYGICVFVDAVSKIL